MFSESLHVTDEGSQYVLKRLLLYVIRLTTFVLSLVAVWSDFHGGCINQAHPFVPFVSRYKPNRKSLGSNAACFTSYLPPNFVISLNSHIQWHNSPWDSVYFVQNSAMFLLQLFSSIGELIQACVDKWAWVSVQTQPRMSPAERCLCSRSVDSLGFLVSKRSPGGTTLTQCVRGTVWREHYRDLYKQSV